MMMMMMMMRIMVMIEIKERVGGKILKFLPDSAH